MKPKIVLFEEISIHASAREATWLTPAFELTYINFNPRLREGGDMFLMILMDIVILFQSTPPRGRRRIVRTSTFAPGMHFNPRLREGGDSAWLPIWFASGYFNPRLREGGDVYEAFYADKYFISIHASAREATTIPALSPLSVARFQSTPPRGRRHRLFSGSLSYAYFNPRLREGGDCGGGGKA